MDTYVTAVTAVHYKQPKFEELTGFTEVSKQALTVKGWQFADIRAIQY